VVTTTRPKPKKRPGKPRNRSTAAWEERDLGVPRPQLPAAAMNRRAVWMRRYVKAATLGFVPALLFSGLAFAASLSDNTSNGDTGDDLAVDQLTAESRAVALTTVTQWLAGDPSPLPGGRVVTWDGYRTVTPVASADDLDDTTETLQTHTITVTANGAFYTAQVQVVVSPTSGARTVGTPALMPAVPAADGYTGTPWPGAQDAKTSDAVPEAVTQWAQTFVGGTPSQLRLAVGDPDTGHSYMPLVGATALNTTVDYVGVRADQLDSEGNVPDSPPQVIARVTITIDWGQASDDPADPSMTPATLTYDVLIDGASTASPRVVAWGGPGTGPDLEPFSNAIAGREITVDTPTQEPPTPGDDTTDTEEDDRG